MSHNSVVVAESRLRRLHRMYHVRRVNLTKFGNLYTFSMFFNNSRENHFVGPNPAALIERAWFT